MTEYTEARKRANTKWDEQNKERKKYLSKRSTARAFIRDHILTEDLDEFKKLVKDKEVEIMEMKNINEVKTNEVYYEFKPSKRGSFYILYDQFLNPTRKGKVRYTDTIKDLTRIAKKKDVGNPQSMYKQNELNNEFVVLEETENSNKLSELAADSLTEK